MLKYDNSDSILLFLQLVAKLKKKSIKNITMVIKVLFKVK